MNIAIVGGGASGMMAAITAARKGATVTLFERNDLLGKKIFATGNGRCNLGNMNLDVALYYCDDKNRLLNWFQQFGVEETLSFFKELGLLIKDKNGYLYPYSEQASAVWSVLTGEIKRLPIKVIYDFFVTELYQTEDGFQVFGRSADIEKTYSFDRVILCTGGKAAPKTGSDGSGEDILKRLGIAVTQSLPALTGLYCKEKWFHDLAGVRARGRVSLCLDGEVIASDIGELQLTDYGISGIPVFAVSHMASKYLAEGKSVSALLDFYPDMTNEEYDALVRDRAALRTDGTMEEYFCGTLHEKLTDVLMKLSGINKNDPVTQVLQYAPHKIDKYAKLARGLCVEVIRTGSFEQSQVTAGGCSILALTDTLQVKNIPGLYVTGELVDVDGVCGGYNLQWAWTSGYIAGTEAANA